MNDPQTDDAIAALPAFQPPATFGQVWSANFGAAGLNTPVGVREPKLAALKDLRDAYQRATGQDAYAAAAAAGRAIPDDPFGTSPNDAAAVIGRLAGDLPDHQFQQVQPFLDIDARAATLAQQSEQQAAAVDDRAYGLTTIGASYAASLARSMVDPTTIAGSLVGAPEVGPLRNWAVREFAVNAGLTAVQHPLVTMGREQLGLPTTPFLQDVIEGGVSGVALGGVMRAGGWALRRLFRGGAPAAGAPAGEAAGEGSALSALSESAPPPGVEAPPPGFALREGAPAADAQAALGALDPADFDAAARWAEARDEQAASVGATELPFRLALDHYLEVTSGHLEAGDIQAWHASPHDFDEFSTSAIGSGEGLQAYGSGLYFAESPRTMLHYRAQFGGDSAVAYHVNIDAEPHELLDWDKPIADQSPEVRDAVAAIGGTPASQFDTAGAWLKAREAAVGARAAAEELRAAGVPGLRYLDAFSRRQGEGTRNFVMFDDKRVRVISKNLEPVGDRPAELADGGRMAPAPAGRKPEGGAAQEAAASPDGVANTKGAAAPSKEADRGEAEPAAGDEPPPAPVAPVSRPERPGAALPDIAAQRADVERALAEAEGQGAAFKIADTDEAGASREVSARDALREADELVAGEREFNDCIARFAPKEPA